MAAVTLSAYTIRIKNDKGKQEILSDFGGKNDLLPVLQKFLSDLKSNGSHDAAAKQLLSVVELHQEKGSRILTGTIESGQYGNESKIKDADTQKVVHTKTVKQADMWPFYFLISLPEKKDEGIVILQRMGQFGIRKLVGKELKGLFEKKYPTFTPMINPLMPEEVVKKTLEKGIVTKVRFVRFGVHKDIADAYDKHDHTEEIGSMQLVVSARRGKSLPLLGRVKDVLSKKRQLQNMIELPDFPYETVKVETNVNGRKRTVDLGNLQKVRAYYDVDHDVKRGPNRLFLYTQKTGVPVSFTLPQFVVEDLEACPRISERYWFWTGVGSKETLAGNWRRTFCGLCQIAGVEGGHPHRFRDTLAVELLLDGMPMERISVLLGHSSVKITERHYAPWVQARQAQLESDLVRAWRNDLPHRAGGDASQRHGVPG